METKAVSTQQMLINAKAASRECALLTLAERNRALTAIKDAIIADKDEILRENQKDVDAARETIGGVMIDRLTLTEKRILDMARGIDEVVALFDPLNRALTESERPNGLRIKKLSVPLGVVAIIFESRPNVSVDAAALCIKSGNACVLRGGKEAFCSVGALVNAMRKGLRACGLNENMICRVSDPTREGANELMRARGLIDLLIPRGGAGLIKACVQNAQVPTIETGTGICHIFVDAAADFDMALRIIENAKTSRPSVCNAMEVLLVHRDIARAFLPLLKKRLVEDRRGSLPVELRLDERARAIIDGTAASDTDFDTEFLDYILAVKVVDGVMQAVDHIRAHSTGHSEAIISEDEAAVNVFLSGVDSACVYVNASTRFTDGGEFGLGCEMGISTQKLHARGPMGLEALTSYKYIIVGNGQIR